MTEDPNEGLMTLQIPPSVIKRALVCLDACAQNEREPERYREMYRTSANKLREIVAIYNEKGPMW